MSTKKTGYKALLLRCRELRGQSGLAAYDRAKMLVQVFDDRDFRAEANVLDDHEAADLLDAEIEDLALSFLELRSMIEYFPARDTWKEGRLKKMHAEMLKAHEDAREKPVRAVPKRATIEQVETLSQEKKQAETRAEYLAKDLGESRNRLQELERENQQLRQQLARAEGRIEELERILERETVPA